ncbi:MAG: efflux transporter outer membrane subunit [Phenylobacterium sp.]|nr:efflux transporter outer membrane subunit [Phenylobacterium sp.]MBP8247630.1 efflux transporter outer membrane subunit [Phenylobacterium sp.]
MSKLIDRKARAALTGVSLLALTACATLGPNFAQPAAPDAPGYAMAGDRAAPGVALSPEARTAGPWWLAFGSPELDAVVRQALAGSPTLAEADATLARARAEARAQDAVGDPKVEGIASAQRERINTQAFGFTGFPSPTINLYSLGATVTYDLDLFGGQRRKSEAAKARALAEARRADAAYLTLTGDVVMQALRIAVLRAQIDAVQAMVADDQRTIDMVRKAQQAGGQAPSAVTGGIAQQAQDEALLPPLQRQLDAARHRLALLVGKSPAQWTAPNFDIADFQAPGAVPVSLPSALVRQRPDILAAEAEFHAATADIGAAQAARYPDIRLSAGLTQATIAPENIFSRDSSGWNLMAGLIGPIVPSKQLKSRQRAAEAEALAAQARYNATVLRAFVQVSDVMSNLAGDQAALAARTRAQNAAEATLRDERKALELGGGTMLAVVDAQRQLNLARRNTVAAQGQGLSDTAELFTATAADWRSPS